MLANSVIAEEEQTSENSNDGESCVQMVPFASGREAKVRGTVMQRESFTSKDHSSFNTAKDSFTTVLGQGRESNLSNNGFVTKSKSAITATNSSGHSLDGLKNVISKSKRV